MNVIAKKSLGQNFLIDKNIINIIVETINIKDKIVLEVGPGTGNLTKALLEKKPKKLFVIEKDKNLTSLLKTEFKDKISIINDDVVRLLNSDHAKKNEERPPKPLNKATISGIEVILTFRANSDPIKPPRTIAEITSKGFIISTIVTRTARNMPVEETRLPLAAVSSFDNILRP